ncbi:radical SAM domain-containing protein [Streptomyces viridochromogenes DSM 40736]|uniref:Radical SAM domain-containing protein n=1 Tax=Streptomyces viridochromogenes (strain DSM 40736 / JCM 4977 / BCRC 1201 / Tue 494) TaxID=591159 RepID=D9WZD6_STRVT|nr:FxsB family cyclophane-forming radical SAM/SPASM peptide maturase [Streptomyces viridochromogenes]EFL35439.1 radical SAM domain-containing protein [Streptomyces viridochromogenes DSM 40736]
MSTETGEPDVAREDFTESAVALSPGRAAALPFHTFILKVHSRCDLACDYCYMYTAADQTWRQQPRVMSPAVVTWTARRIAEHVRVHGLRQVAVVLHGGEPLLAGPRRLRQIVTEIAREVGPEVRVRTSVQTNGVRLTDAWLDLFAELDIRVGVSIDGGRSEHDRHRRHPDGRGSHDQVAQAVQRLAAAPRRRLFAGLLCTVDLRNDPVATYEELLRHRPPMIDFLLPLGNWSAPPPGRVAGRPDTPYGDWLAAVFDRWYSAPVRETEVRMLGDLVALLLGGRARVEGLGLEPIRYVVVETDGSIALDDTLRVSYEGATRTGLHVARDSFGRALDHPEVTRRQSGAAGLASVCRACSLLRVCGGGRYTDRYDAADGGFGNPSVYCPDLAALVRHVHRRVAEDTARLRELA